MSISARAMVTWFQFILLCETPVATVTSDLISADNAAIGRSAVGYRLISFSRQKYNYVQVLVLGKATDIAWIKKYQLCTQQNIS